MRNEHSSSINCVQFPDKLRACWLLRKDFAPSVLEAHKIPRHKRQGTEVCNCTGLINFRAFTFIDLYLPKT